MLPGNSPESPFRISYDMVRGHHEELLRQSEKARLLDELKGQQPERISLDRFVSAWLSAQMVRLGNRPQRRVTAWLGAQMVRLGHRLASYRKTAADPMPG